MSRAPRIAAALAPLEICHYLTLGVLHLKEMQDHAFGECLLFAVFVWYRDTHLGDMLTPDHDSGFAFLDNLPHMAYKMVTTEDDTLCCLGISHMCAVDLGTGKLGPSFDTR